jgi:hypothetical protein
MSQSGFKNPLLILNVLKSKKEVRDWTNKVTADNVNQFGRKLGKIAHNNPLIIMSEITGFV